MQRLNFRPMLIDSLKGYTRQGLTRDLLAGLIVGIVALPMAIAFAIASGVSPEVGLVTAVLGGLIVSALGGSSVQIGGPTGAFIIIVLSIIGEYGQGGLLIATLMAGILLLLMGALKLGSLIKFIPYPIILGFTAGIAVTIFTTQVNDLLGLGLTGLPKEFVPKWGRPPLLARLRPPAYARHRSGEHPPHSAHPTRHKGRPWLPRRHHRDDHRLLPPQGVCWRHGPRHHRRPLHDLLEDPRPRRARAELGDDAAPHRPRLHHRPPRCYRVPPLCQRR